MTLEARTYFGHLRAYVNDDYVIHDGTGGKVVLTEKYFRPEDVTPQKREVELLLPSVGMAFKLDHDDFDASKRGVSRHCSIFSTIPQSPGLRDAISWFFTLMAGRFVPTV